MVKPSIDRPGLTSHAADSLLRLQHALEDLQLLLAGKQPLERDYHQFNVQHPASAAGRTTFDTDEEEEGNVPAMTPVPLKISKEGKAEVRHGSENMCHAPCMGLHADMPCILGCMTVQ